MRLTLLTLAAFALVLLQTACGGAEPAPSTLQAEGESQLLAPLSYIPDIEPYNRTGIRLGSPSNFRAALGYGEITTTAALERLLESDGDSPSEEAKQFYSSELFGTWPTCGGKYLGQRGWEDLFGGDVVAVEAYACAGDIVVAPLRSLGLGQEESSGTPVLAFIGGFHWARAEESLKAENCVPMARNSAMTDSLSCDARLPDGFLRFPQLAHFGLDQIIIAPAGDSLVVAAEEKVVEAIDGGKTLANNPIYAAAIGNLGGVISAVAFPRETLVSSVFERPPDLGGQQPDWKNLHEYELAAVGLRYDGEQWQMRVALVYLDDQDANADEAELKKRLSQYSPLVYPSERSGRLCTAVDTQVVSEGDMALLAAICTLDTADVGLQERSAYLLRLGDLGFLALRP